MFRCKQFNVAQDKCAMKVNTDSLILGSWVAPNNAQSLLDIGTGTGLIAIMVAQKNLIAEIDAIDIDKAAYRQALKNVSLCQWKGRIKVHHQSVQDFINVERTFNYDVIVCNPPFFKSEAEALEATIRKLKGLNKETSTVIRNFSGTHNELWYKGGEKAFLHNYLYESSLFKDQCQWFTTLVSKKDLVKGMYASLKKLGATDIKTITMGQGNKISRIVAWTFK